MTVETKRKIKKAAKITALVGIGVAVGVAGTLAATKKPWSKTSPELPNPTTDNDGVEKEA